VKSFTRKTSSLALAIASISLMHTVTAAESRPALEEITVTAQKREENLSDVPISVSVVDSARLQAGNINKIADIAEFVPNLSMTETGISTQLYIRGIGSGNNQAFEQSVGQFVDGVYYSRQQLIRAPFMDLDRVEVLRGPQGTLFGKNSIAGALNMTTARPGNERELSVNALYEFESSQQEYTLVASGPLTDTFRARVAYRGYQEDGYVRNTLKNTDEPQRDEDALRVTFGWDLTPDLTATLKLEDGSYDTQGRQIEIVMDMPNRFPAGATPIAGLTLGQILPALGQPALDGVLDFNRQANELEFSNSNYDNATLTLEYDMNGYNLTSVTANVSYDFRERCDCDYTGANIFFVKVGEDYEQFSQELRLSSPQDQPLSWLVGGYLQNSEFDSSESFSLPADSLLRTLALTSPDPRQKALVALLGTELLRINRQESDAWATFFQGTWNINDSLRLIAGGRYTEEDKSAYRDLNVYAIGSTNPPPSPQAPLVYFGAFNIYSQQTAGVPVAPGVVLPGHLLRGDRNESQFTPVATLQWDMNDQSMLYASYTKGFKGGGFDARANNPFSFEFEEEQAKSFELGAKNRLLNGALELNAALYFTTYEDLQVSQYDGTLGFNVGNAKETEVSGLELDGRWAATDNLTVSYAYSWLDFEFTDFQNGNCHNRQVPDGPVLNGVGLCNYTGKSGQYTPKNSLSLGFDHSIPVFGNLELNSSLMMNYRSEQNVHENLDPLLVIDAVTRFNMRVALQADRWQVAFVGKNLTDEKVLTYAANVPLTASTFGTNTFYGMVDRGRQLALEAGFRF